MSKKIVFRYTLSIVFLMMLTLAFSACNFNPSIKKENKRTYLKVSVSSVSRTAIPHFTDVSEISDFRFKLFGKGPDDSSLTELTDSSENYDLEALQGASFPTEPGEWTFELTASKDGTEFTSGEISKTISSGSNTIAFELNWDDTSLGGTGSLSFTLDFSAAPNKSSVTYATTELLKYNSSTGTYAVLNNETSIGISAGKVIYAPSSLASGNYKLLVRLYGDDTNTNNTQHILLFTWTELAIITGGQESKGSRSVSDLNELYTITWHNLNLTGVSSPDTLPGCYSRFSEAYTLPVSGVSRTGTIFGGWYSDPDYQTPITAIPANSNGNLNIYAHFIDSIYIKDGGVAYTDGVDGTTEATALNSIDSAISKIIEYANPAVNWKIVVLGEVKGLQNIGNALSTTEHTPSLTIIGKTGNTTDILNADIGDTAQENGSTLTIQTSVPVTIQNLKITGGNTTGKGGGLNIVSGANVTLSYGVEISSNMAAQKGSAVYVAGSLSIGGNVSIPDDGSGTNDIYLNYTDGTTEISPITISKPLPETGFSVTITPCSYDEGSVVLNCAADSGTTRDAEYEKIKVTPPDGITNWKVSSTGKIFKALSETDIAEMLENAASGETVTVTLYENYTLFPIESYKNAQDKYDYSLLVPSGKKLKLLADKEVTITTRTLCNYGIGIKGELELYENIIVKTAGGGLTNTSPVKIESGGVFTLKGGTIKGCSQGGSIYGTIWVSSNGTFVMESGLITENKRFGCVYVDTNGSFTMKGGIISKNFSNSSTNGGGVTVKSGGTFIQEGGTVCENYYNSDMSATSGDSSQLYIASGGKYGTSTSNVITFAQAYSAASEPFALEYVGVILGNKTAPTAIGDVLLSDGSAIAYSSTMSPSDTQIQNAIGVVYGVENSAPLGIIGLQNSGTTKYKWSPESYLQYAGNVFRFEPLVCNPSASNVTITSSSPTFEGDTEGSDNWAYICAIDPAGTANAATNYPAFNYVNNYAQTAGLTGDYANGWYMPGIKELCIINRNKTKINTVLGFLNGVTLAESSYLSSSQQNDTDTGVLSVNMSTNQLLLDARTSEFSVCAVRSLSAQDCSVFFMTDGGSAVETQKVVIGQTATAPAEDPTKTGYTFGGWYTDKNLTQEFSFDTQITAHTVVFAKWTPDFYAMVGNSRCNRFLDTIYAIEDMEIPTVETDLNIVLSGLVQASNLGPSSTSGTILNAIKTKTAEDSDKKLRIHLSIAKGETIALPEDCTSFFDDVEAVSIDCTGYDASAVTNMNGMFSQNQRLQSLNLSGFDTSNVTDMSFMFYNCEQSLTELDLSSFNTTKVTDMGSMFYGCKYLTTIKVGPYFVTGQVTSSSEMFGATSSTYCSALVGGKGTTFDTTKTDKSYARVDRTGTQGYFTQTEFIGTKDAPTQVYDIVFNDGSATPYTNGLNLTAEQKQAAIAIIFYNGTNCNNEGETAERLLGVGLVHNYNTALSSEDAKIMTYDVTSTYYCNVSGSVGNYTFSGKKNGSQNFADIQYVLNAYNKDDTAEESKYPGFYWAINYKNNLIGSETESRIISGTDFTDGWYIPSTAELYELYKVVETVSNASSYCLGDTFEGTSPNTYVTSSKYPDTNEDHTCSTIEFATGTWNGIAWSTAKYICAIHEF